MKNLRTIVLVSLFAAAFAFVESSVVVYLRQLFYPTGFAFPLKPMPSWLVMVELAREFATLVMLLTIGMIAGKSSWQRFSYFMVGFGVWDIFYYIWLKLLLDWPASLADLDILFLIPVPWIGPVLAPVLVSLVMIAGAVLIIRRGGENGQFRPRRSAIILSLLGSGIILSSFLLDTDAAVRFQVPRQYHYEMLVIGMVCYVAAFVVTLRRHPILS
jgi:hypothetical protein